MKKMKFLLLITNRYKALLLKLLPHELLRNMKKRVINKSIGEMSNIEIKPFEAQKYKQGINLIGDIKAKTGLGQSCRLVANEVKASDINYTIYQYNQIGEHKSDDNSWDDCLSEELPYNINLIHINPNELGLAFLQMDPSIWDYRYNIAFWLWELEEFPDEWVPCISCLDEIWTPSEFISNSLRMKTEIPVKTIPYHVDAKIKQLYERDFFGLPNDKFLFLVMYDSNSITERKNPLGTLEAFKKAFQKENMEVGLVIKINNANKEDIRQINSRMDGYQNVYMITDTLDKDQVNSLIKNCNVIVSLHRAEGFGLVLAEAMLLGIPTIATNWSSNIEFMNSEVACMVNYKLITLDRDMGPFKKGNHWADPDIDEAAEYMRKLFTDKCYYDNMAISAKLFIENKLSMEQAAKAINKRVKEICGENG